MKRLLFIICLIALTSGLNLELLSNLLNSKSNSTVQAQTLVDPERPRIFLDTTYAPPTGNRIAVRAGGDLQSALNQAAPGDEIVLDAGATYLAPPDGFSLPPKFGDRWITIRGATPAGISAEGTRINPSQHAAAMPKIVSRNAGPALVAQAQSTGTPHHYRFVGIEFTMAPGVTLNYGLVQLGRSGSAQSTQESVPHDIIIDRCYIHGSATANLSRGVALNSARTAIIDSYISECHGIGFDTQAVCGWNGPGPFKIVNNYLEAAGENVMFGGADPSIQGLVPSDIEFRRNHCFKPLSWNPSDPNYSGTHWSVKNIFELKNACRVLVEGNLFENNWADAQSGPAILFTPRNQEGTAPWSMVKDVSFVNNLVRNVAAGVHILGRDYIYPSQQAQRIKIENNLFVGVGAPLLGSNGRLFQIVDGAADVIINHNTAFQSRPILIADGEPTTGLVFSNNITAPGEYGIFGSGAGEGNLALATFFPGATVQRNVLTGRPSWLYPLDNYFPYGFDDVKFVDMAAGNYRLSTASLYKKAGTDGKDIGADLDAIESAMRGQGQSINQPPQVSVAASITSGVAPLSVAFTSSAVDSDGQIVSYHWDFGDGQTADGPSASHTYMSAGTFTSLVTVTDNGGEVAHAFVTIEASAGASTSDIVLYASEAQVKVGKWTVVADSTAAGGARIHFPDARATKLAAPLAGPSHYFEMSFNAVAGKPYRLWMRGKAQNDFWGNDSVFAQFSGSVDANGKAVYRIGTTDGTVVNLEDCSGCGISGWGWQDNGWGVGVLGPVIYFAQSGTQTIRVQSREDGFSIDQIVLSSAAFLNTAPGALRNDDTFLSKIGASQPLAPSVTSVSPASGVATGGTAVTLTGSGFVPGATVNFGGAVAADVVIVSSTTIKAFAPAHAAGAVDIEVKNVDGLSGVLRGGYAYMASPNRPPEVSISPSATSGFAPLQVVFTANAFDADGRIAAYLWNFGDGQTSAGAQTTRIFQTPGTYKVRLTVTDDAGASATAESIITVKAPAPPVVTVLRPNTSEVLRVNTTYTIRWSVSGTGVQSHSIQLSTDGGATWVNVAQGLPGTATSYSWRVPTKLTRYGRIRVQARDASGQVGQDKSDYNFTIKR
jgi:PKD repeat protein